MGGRPQKREKASGRKGGNWVPCSTFHVKRIHVGMLSRLDAFRVYVGPRLRVYVGRVGRGYGWTRLGLDGVTLRGC